MLDNQDLQKITEILNWKLDEKLELNNKVLEQNLRKQIKEELKPLKSSIRKLSKKLDLMIQFFDGESIDLKKRVVRIERLLELPSLYS